MARLTKALVLILGVVDEDRKMDLHQFVLKSENPFFDLFAATIALFKLTVRMFVALLPMLSISVRISGEK